MDENQGNDVLEESNQIEREIENLEEANKKQGQRIRNMESKALQNVNLYFIFQAVILASITATPSPSCRIWWIPFILSLLAAATNLHGYWSALSKVLRFKEELDQNLSELAFMKTHKTTQARLDQASTSRQLTDEGAEIIRPEVSKVKMWRRNLVAYLSIGLFIGFSAVIMYGCYNILCRSGDKKCIKLC